MRSLSEPSPTWHLLSISVKSYTIALVFSPAFRVAPTVT